MKSQYQINQEIEALITSNDAQKLKYSKADLELIKTYSGSGGQGKKGASGEGILYEFFTPSYICELIWKLANHYGYDNGYVLEPSIATGRLIENAPDHSKCVGFEINHFSKRIAELCYPKATIHEGYFETAFLNGYTKLKGNKVTWLEQYPFSLVIGNPPFGKYNNFYSSYFPVPKLAQIEQFFFYYGLKLLKPGGLLIYVVSSNFMRNGITYTSAKNEIGRLGKLVDAYRLPSVFDFSDIPTDIIILKRI